MADSIYTFDPVAANNSTLDSIPYGPNQLYHNQIDNWFRSLGSKLAQYVDDLGAVNTVGGTANAITVTIASGITAYATGQMFRFKNTVGPNTAATTINVNAIGAKEIRLQGDTALSGGEMLDNGVYTLVYDAAYDGGDGGFILLNPAPSAVSSGAPFPTRHVDGLALSNDSGDLTNDIGIATGTARDQTDAVNMVLASALVKRTDAAWAVGTNQGLWLDGSSMPDGNGHVFLIKRGDTGVVDVGASASLAPTLPTGYDYKRRIGSIVRSSGSVIRFIQTGSGAVRRYDFTGGPIVASGSPYSSMGTSAATRTLVGVPTGFQVSVILHVGFQLNGGEGAYGYISALDTTDVAAAVGNANVGGLNNNANPLQVFSQMQVRSNDMAQVRSRFSASSGSITLWLNTVGWIDSL